MIPIQNLNLEYAKYIYHPETHYPAVEISIDGRKGYLIQIDINNVHAGFVGITDTYFVNEGDEWRTHLPKVHVPEQIARKYGLPSILTGVTTDPKIVQIAEKFWKAINNGTFVPDQYVFKKE